MKGSEPFREFWPILGEEIFKFRDWVDSAPVIPEFDLSEIRAHLAENYSFESGLSEEEVIRGAAGMLTRWNLHTPSPKYFGLFNPDVIPMAVAGDALAAALNPQLAAWSHSPAANEIERHTLRFFMDLMGYPDEAVAN